MLTCGEMALKIAAAAVRVDSELTLVTHKFLDGVAQDAAGLIGHEQDAWAPLAESTVREKKRLGFVNRVSPTDPLLRTGELRGSIESDAAKTGSGVEGVVGTNDKVAVYQELGTSRIPPRPFLAAAMAQAQPKAEKAFGEFLVLALASRV